MALPPITVLGAGSWGTAVAWHMAQLGQEVCLWGRDQNQMRQMAEDRENAKYLPGIVLPQTMRFTSDIEEACHGVRDVCLMVPSGACPEVLKRLGGMEALETLTWGSKGLCALKDHVFLHELVEETLPGVAYGLLSGPTFAQELARGVPTALVMASASEKLLDLYGQRLHGGSLRCYRSNDVVGVELCGVMKNILALASGISDGLGLGANARSALITRGLAEMIRLGLALGAEERTFMGLAGVGDTILSCTSDLSRNRRFGLQVGKGQHQVQKSMGQVVESDQNIEKVFELANKHQIEMPIVQEVYAILHQGQAPKEAMVRLLSREAKSE